MGRKEKLNKYNAQLKEVLGRLFDDMTVTELGLVMSFIELCSQSQFEKLKVMDIELDDDDDEE